MSSESTGSEILDQFRSISNKLKKRFLRKPNVTEASESFSALGQQCENSELPSYAGMCWISAARCEGSIGNISTETNCLLRAGKQFLKSEDDDHRLGCPSPANENLEAALGCYAYASSRFTEDNPFSVSLSLELVDFFKKTGNDANIEEILLNAIRLCGENFQNKIYCLNLLASYYIETRIYVSALNTFTDIVNLAEKFPINGAWTDILLKCEVCRIFLLLILKPLPQKLSPSLNKLLENYTWGDSNDKTLKGIGMSEEMFITLQSLVASCQSKDSTNLASLETVLWNYLDNDERELLRILVKMHNH